MSSLLAPTGFKYILNSLNYPIFTWYPIAGAVSYNIYQRNDALVQPLATLNLAPIALTTYTDLTFNPLVENYYFVTAVNSAGIESLPSATIYIAVQTNSEYVMPRVDLWAPAFDKFLLEHGYDVIWEKAISCPCNKSAQTTTDASDLDCKLCNNKHYIWVNPQPIKCAMTSIGRNFDLREDGIYQMGSYKVTTHSSNFIGFYDRLSFQDTSAPLSETIIKGVSGGSDSLRFPAYAINLPIIDLAGNYYYNGPDFTLNAAGQITWNGSSGRQPSTGTAYGSAYMTQWRMLSTEYSHDVRGARIMLDSSSPVYVPLARQIVARLEWFYNI